MGLDYFGKLMLTIGLLLVIAGGVMVLVSKLGLGRLPGDIFIRKGNVSFYFPLATSIIISVVLSLLFNLITRR